MMYSQFRWPAVKFEIDALFPLSFFMTPGSTRQTLARKVIFPFNLVLFIYFVLLNGSFFLQFKFRLEKIKHLTVLIYGRLSPR